MTHLEPTYPGTGRSCKQAARFWRALLLLILCQAASSAWAGDSKLDVVFPPENSALQSVVTSLTLRVAPGSVDELQLWVNGRRVKTGKKDFRQQTLCYDGIELSFGMNEIRAVGLKGGGKVDEVRIKVFRRSDLAVAASTAPAGFETVYFHETGREKLCMPCHQLNLKATADGPEGSPEESPCYQCHKKLLGSFATAHGPAAVWSCLTCHDSSGGRRFSVTKPEGEVCNGCHENSWGTMKFGHGPTAAGSCATCHDPHASDYPYFLRTPLMDVCTGCHEDVLTKPHVLVGFSNTGHPVRRNVDPYHPNRPFTCVSCHNPHAGSSWVFLQNYDGVSEISDFCRTCHIM